MIKIFGEPNKGIHAYRFLGYAFFDILFTVIAAIILHYVIDTPVVTGTAVLFIVGQLLHVAFGVETQFIQNVKRAIST